MIRRLLRPTFLTSCLATTLVFAAACSGGDADSPPSGDDPEVTASTEAPVTTAPPGVPPGAVELGFGDLEVGQCFDTIDDIVVGELAVWALDCATPHTFEVFDQFDYDGEQGEDGAYPGIDVVQEWSERACHDRFEAFVGKRWTVSELEIQLWWPSEESWDRGDDTVICAVLEDSGERVTGTLRGAAR